MIDWINEDSLDRPVLVDSNRTVTYRELKASLAAAPKEGITVLRPSTDVDSALAILSGMSGGTTVLLGPHQEAPEIGELPATTSTVIFTSGSTGRPKGVRLTLDNWRAAAHSSTRHLKHGPDDVWLVSMPLHHVGGLGAIVRSVYGGGSVRLVNGFDARGYAELLHQVTFASVVPTMLLRLLDVSTSRYDNLKGVLVGGGPIPAGLLERAWSSGIPSLPTYGMTETCGQIATGKSRGRADRGAELLPDVEVKVDGNGLIHVRGPMLSPGYLGSEDRAPGAWFLTNDRGALDRAGNLTVTGRADEMIVTGGENVHPSMVEAAMIAIDGISAAIAVGIGSPEWGQEVQAVYVGDVEPLAADALLRAQLPAHAMPKKLVAVDSIPLTALGKPDRLAVRGLLAQR